MRVFFICEVFMTIHCVWEHNGPDTLLYAVDCPGAYTRGASLKEALAKMPDEIRSWKQWAGETPPESVECAIVQEQFSHLLVRDADSDVLFESEKAPLTLDEYAWLKSLVLKSAADFQTLYDAIPDAHISCLKPRVTFYGALPLTAQQMYQHTHSVNPYYFGEIHISADAKEDILACRERGFALLEMQKDFLQNRICNGSYGERWSLRKVMRRFLWHDRIHAKAMYRMALRTFPHADLPNSFFFT